MPPNDTKTLLRAQSQQSSLISTLSPLPSPSPPLTLRPLHTLITARKEAHSHPLPLPLLKPIHLPIRHILIHIRQTPHPPAHIPPPPLRISPFLFTPIQRQRRRQNHMYPIAHRARVQFGVDIDVHTCVGGEGGAREAGDAVVFLGVDGGEGEGFFEEEGVCHCGGSGGLRRVVLLWGVLLRGCCLGGVGGWGVEARVCFGERGTELWRWGS